jgi:DNA polymerase-3 subunit epsilon
MAEGFFDFYTERSEEQEIEKAVFVAFDFETTGLYPDRDRIIEIGAVKFNLQGAIEIYQHLVDPGIEIPEESIAIHQITNEMVKGKPGIQDLLPDFLKFIGDSILIAHNIKFDQGFLNAALADMGENPPTNRGIDTCNLSRRVVKGRRSYSLQNLAKYFAIPVNNAHRALDDAMICMELFKKIIARIDIDEDHSVGFIMKIVQGKKFREREK